MRHKAIYSTHSNVLYIKDEVAFDKNENQVQLDETIIKVEVVRLQAEWDALAWKRSREENYPSIAELTVALYDTDDKSAVEAKRAAVKAKYPKPS